MPNYLYKCTECDHEDIFTLSISSNPKKKLLCKKCADEHPNVRPYPELTMTRRISSQTKFLEKSGKVFAGDWFKKTYGHDIGAAYEDKARQSEDRKTLEREYKKQNEI